MRDGTHGPVLEAFLGNFGNGSTSTKFKRELQANAKNVMADVNKSCGAKHWWSQVCSKALARGVKRSVFVITSGQPTALKFTMRGEAPRSLSVSVADMGPDGVGDALVSDDDVVLLYNGHDHYNGLVASSVAEGLA